MCRWAVSVTRHDAVASVRAATSTEMPGLNRVTMRTVRSGQLSDHAGSVVMPKAPNSELKIVVVSGGSTFATMRVTIWYSA